MSEKFTTHETDADWDAPRRHGLKLRPEESLVEVTQFELAKPARHLSVLRAVMNLTMAPRPSEIGLHGPSIAASVTEANKEHAELNLYQVFFPRDGHIVARFLEDKFPALTDTTVMESLRFTGVRMNLQATGLKDEQEVWKVPHETRDGETDPRAKYHSETKDWGWPYYGAIDTTGKNILAIARIVRRPNGLSFLDETYEGRDGKRHTVEEALTGHLNWLRNRMALNPEGLLEMLWLNPKHHANQTWADSPDAFHHADGSWARHYPEKNWGVAPLELQAETYDALVAAAEVYRKLLPSATGLREKFLLDEINDLEKRSAQLREVVISKFWVDDDEHFGGYFARGTDRDDNGNLEPLAIRTSDMGHLLLSNILDGDEPEIVKKREAVIRNLFSPEMLCPSGIRTLSSDSVRYFEDRYHNGNSWPWVTYYIALGLEKHGYHNLAEDLKYRVWSLYDSTHMLPEYGTGSDDPTRRLVTQKVVIADPSLGYKESHQISQPPQEIQAWTAAAVLALKYENGRKVFGHY